jgi:hypothetical protein
MNLAQLALRLPDSVWALFEPIRPPVVYQGTDRKAARRPRDLGRLRSWQSAGRAACNSRAGFPEASSVAVPTFYGVKPSVIVLRRLARPALSLPEREYRRQGPKTHTPDQFLSGEWGRAATGQAKDGAASGSCPGRARGSSPAAAHRPRVEEAASPVNGLLMCDLLLAKIYVPFVTSADALNGRCFGVSAEWH